MRGKQHGTMTHTRPRGDIKQREKTTFLPSRPPYSCRNFLQPVQVKRLQPAGKASAGCRCKNATCRRTSCTMHFLKCSLQMQPMQLADLKSATCIFFNAGCMDIACKLHCLSCVMRTVGMQVACGVHATCRLVSATRNACCIKQQPCVCNLQQKKCNLQR